MIKPQRSILIPIVLLLAILVSPQKSSAFSRIIRSILIVDTVKSQSIIDSDKFSIALPAGWKHFNKISEGFNILFLMAPPADNFASNINILTENIKGMPVARYLKISDENMQKAGMVLDGSGDFDAGNYHGRYTTSSYDYQGRSLALKTYIFVKDGLAYVITGTCLISQKDSYRPIFDQTIKTFKIK